MINEAKAPYLVALFQIRPPIMVGAATMYPEKAKVAITNILLGRRTDRIKTRMDNKITKILPSLTSLPLMKDGANWPRISRVSMVLKLKNIASIDEVRAARIPANAIPESQTGRYWANIQGRMASDAFPGRPGFRRVPQRPI